MQQFFRTFYEYTFQYLDWVCLKLALLTLIGAGYAYLSLNGDCL
jgi:amino acid permease